MLGRERIKLTNIDIIRPEREAAAAVYRLLREAKAPALTESTLPNAAAATAPRFFVQLTHLLKQGLLKKKLINIDIHIR